MLEWPEGYVKAWALISRARGRTQACTAAAAFATLRITGIGGSLRIIKKRDLGAMTDQRLTTDDVRHIALLARIGMTDEEIERMRDQLSNILENFDILTNVDTEGVEPTGHSVNVTSVMREDKSRESLSRDDVLGNAPLVEGDRIRVRAVLE